MVSLIEYHEDVMKLDKHNLHILPFYLKLMEIKAYTLLRGTFHQRLSYENKLLKSRLTKQKHNKNRSKI